MQNHKKNILIAITALFLVALSGALKAQNSTSIHGQVLDEFTKAPVSNANLEVLGTKIGDAADSSGIYKLDNLIAGTYFIRVSRIGYKPKIIEKVNLKSGENKRLDIYLSSTTLKLEKVEVEAERLW